MSNKIKVGFHLNNQNHPSVDLQQPERGNPGIGGTEFTSLAVAYYLRKFYESRIEPILLAGSNELLPPILPSYPAENLTDAAVKAKKVGCEIFVFRSQNGHSKIYADLSDLQLSSVSRSNNTPDYPGLLKIAKSPHIKCHVCVGQEQLDLLRDHRVILKSTRIFHPFNPTSFTPQSEIEKDPNLVVYLGSITPGKGFHHLAQAWPKILEQHPTAKLLVIGSGKLYNREAKLGEWGIAEESYEAKGIRPYLSDDQGNTHRSVCFKGVLGSEKIPILQRATVGVVNPTGYSEVCCASSLEFQACGTAVVGGADWGLLDTVLHRKTGLLSKNQTELVSHILYFLRNPDAARSFGVAGIRFVQEEFSPAASAAQWMQLFEDIVENRKIKTPRVKSNLLHRGKIFREGAYVLRKHVPFMGDMPSFYELKQMLKKS